MSAPDNSGVAEALEFLEGLHPGEDWHLTAILPDGPIRNRTFGPDEREAAAEAIQANIGHRNIYVHVNRVKPGISNVKAKKEMIEAAVYVHIDIDDAQGLERLHAFNLPPTAVVLSGGGYNAYWKLAEPLTDLDQAESINRWLVQQLDGDRAATDVSRILRVPGTLNLPTKTKRERGRVEVRAQLLRDMTDWTRTYDIGQFGHTDTSKPLPRDESTRLRSEPSPPLTIEPRPLPEGLDERIAQVARIGDDPKRPRGRPNARYPSRSEAVFAVACALGRSGRSIEDIAGILLNPELGVSASIREKRNPEAEAIRQATKAMLAVGNDWPDGCNTKSDTPLRGFLNTQTAILRLGISCAFDIFRNRMTISGKALPQDLSNISERVTIFIRDLICKTYGFDPANEMTRDALVNLCSQNTFDPVCDYLDSLIWDGVPRINGFLTNFAEAEDSDYTRAVSSIIFIAAVRRVRSPGVKFDTIPVLEGDQGTGKSTLIKILASPEFFSDQDLLALDQKAQMEIMEGVWLFELCELAGIRFADVNKVKAFASRSVDKARPAYGRVAEERPRRGIMIGTTNDDQYLKDETGNRRFWPVATGAIDLESIAAERDQLWAEASAREAKGEGITLSPRLWPAAAVEQGKRVAADPWQEALEHVQGWAHNGREMIATSTLLGDVLNIPGGQYDTIKAKRLARAMKALGWHGPDTLTLSSGRKAKGYWRLTQRPDEMYEGGI